MAMYLEQGEVSPEQLHAPFEKALREGHLIPVCFTSAKNGAGVEELLDIFAEARAQLRPKAMRRRSSRAKARTRRNSTPSPTRASTCSRTCSRSSSIPIVGKLGIFRVHQGTVTPQLAALRRQTAGGRSRSGTCIMLQGKDYVETDALVPGDIGAVAKVEEIEFDCGAARLARRGPHPPAAARIPGADARPRGGDEEEGRRAAAVRGAAQAGDGRPVLQGRAPPDHQRDRDPRPGRAAPAHQAGKDDAAVQAGLVDQAAEDPLPRDHRRKAPKATAATRSRPAAPASSARCS